MGKQNSLNFSTINFFAATAADEPFAAAFSAVVVSRRRRRHTHTPTLADPYHHQIVCYDTRFRS